LRRELIICKDKEQNMYKSDKSRGLDVNKNKGRRIVVSTKNSFKIQAEPLYKYNFLENDYRIVPTPFDIKERYDDYPNINYYDNCIDFKYSIIDIREFGYVFERLSKGSMRVLMNMLYNLENDTNLVKFNINEFCRFRKEESAREYAIYKELIENNLIVRTNQKCTYIINHNIFYKGDLNKFREKYYRLYSDYELEYNEKGEVIISNI